VKLPPGSTWRPALLDDVDAILSLLHVGDVLEVGEADTPRDFVEEVFSSPFADPACDLWVVEDDGSGVIAYGDVQTPNPRTSLDAFVRVHPDHRGRGISTALLDHAEARALERMQVGDRLRFKTTASAHDEIGMALLRARGADHVRSFHHMERSLEGLERAGAPPAGVRFRGLGDDDWAVFHEVLETAFADHYDFEPISLETFVTMWTTTPHWDPALVTLAERDGRVIGLVSSTMTSTPGLGWVSDVGVLPEHRGQGIAQALLLRSFGDLAERGCDRVRLNVDAANGTGAVQLYEKVGMRVRREWAVHEQILTRG